MAIIILKNGKRLKVTYSKAATVNDVLSGRKDLENEAQAKFCEQVQAIEFENESYIGKTDTIMHNILDDSKLSGYEKFKLAGQRIKERASNK